MDEPEQRSIRTPTDGSELTPHFKLIFVTVVTLTLLALTVNVLLAIVGPDSDQVKATAEACSTTYKMGFGAIVGLLGARNT